MLCPFGAVSLCVPLGQCPFGGRVPLGVKFGGTPLGYVWGTIRHVAPSSSASPDHLYWEWIFGLYSSPLILIGLDYEC